jgi:hypothetical protein
MADDSTSYLLAKTLAKVADPPPDENFISLAG